jgi:2-methylisocitrate lyase-like PEP mutase family enzyme
MESARRLRRRLDAADVLVCPGAHDALTAKVLDHVGFDAIYMTGYGTSLSRTGHPDAGLITMTEMLANARAIQQRISVPLIADADTGFGNAINLIRTVEEYITAGIAGIQLEDQQFPKRCGHVEGRQVVGAEEAVGKVAAAADTRDAADGDIVIIARTDARGAVDGSVDAAIDRANAFLSVGADVAFVEGLVDLDEARTVAAAVDGPLLYNATGISPLADATTLTEAGFDILLYPGISTRATILAMLDVAEGIRSDGSAAVRELYAAMEDAPIGSLHEFSGFPQIVEWEERYLPEGELQKYEDTLGEFLADDGA